MTLGGLKEVVPADAAAVEAVNAVRKDAKLAAVHGDIQPISYATQLVNGVNYFIKAKVEGGFIHLRIHKTFSGEFSLHSIKEGMSADSALEYF